MGPSSTTEITRESALQMNTRGLRSPSAFCRLAWLLVASLLGLFNLGEWANEVGGLLTLKLSTVANGVPFMLMILVLLLRPAGLMGDRQ